MTPLFISIAIGLVCFVVTLAVINRLSGQSRTEQMLAQMNAGGAFPEDGLSQEAVSIMRTDFSDMPVLRALAKLPFGEEVARKILRAGLEKQAAVILIVVVFATGLVPFLVYESSGRPFFALLSALLVPYLFWRHLQGRIQARNRKFINDFPDVLDMIVRSVRSGFPLNTALKMVAENMEPPVSTEFRQVIDEIALGRSTDDALMRLTHRIDEQDVKFFIVVLRVQQETGGNLAEVVSNLSNVIRKRKQLRLKIRAMTSEGRATGWILGAIPVLVFLALYFIAPGHLEPMLNTSTGNILLGVAFGLIVLAQVIVRKMLNVEI
jgi:tight adherence protein B